ncbi:hypothetical protein DDT48_20160 [Mycobacteroides abscessus]|uniref:hypothetical protein n=1 Tax=Mycobacteroides abscessus TaxID=36809 RepID=UPI000C257621|nr:hypothetical protein [Mycobacteroides abscessus]AWG51484.1 hypothetical protein DDT48_20160 [Mycobacteroides abscessus]
MSAVDEYQAATEQLATSTERQALAIYAELQADRLPPSETTLLLAALINRANASAVSLADVWLAVQIEEQTGQPVPTVGVLPVDDSERLAKAVNTVLSEGNGGQSVVNAGQKQAGVSDDRANHLPDAGQMADQTNAPDMRLQRMARGEVFEAAQRATHDAMQKQPLVEGWVRHMDADPCQLCRWWWREGRIWPKSHRMPTHKGCNCQPRIVAAQSIKPVRAKRG